MLWVSAGTTTTTPKTYTTKSICSKEMEGQRYAMGVVAGRGSCLGRRRAQEACAGLQCPSNSILFTKGSYDFSLQGLIYRQAETSEISLKEQFRAEQSFVQNSALTASFVCLPLLGCLGAGTMSALGPQLNAYIHSRHIFTS